MQKAHFFDILCLKFQFMKGMSLLPVNAALWDFEFHVEYSENDIWKHPTANQHFHRVYEIYYLVKNEISYFIDNKAVTIKEGTVVIVPPHAIHSTRCLNNNIRKRFLIYIPETFISDFLNDEPELLKRLEVEPFIIKPSNRPQIEKLFFDLLSEFQSKNTSVVMQKALLGELLITLWRLFLEGKTSTVTTVDSSKRSKQILTIANYISSNFNQNITLESLSKQFFLHPAYISRAFKKQLNINFTEYIKSVRIKEATILLKNSTLDVAKIAKMTGFESATTLTRAFKETLGITPLQYRKIHKEKR